MSPAANRRGFLRGFAAFSAGSVASGAVVALERPPNPDVELLRLGVELTAATSAYDEAAAALARCKEAWETVRPEVPPELNVPAFRGWVDTEWPPAFSGRPCNKHVQNRVRIPSRYDLDRLVKVTDGRTVRGKYLRRLKPISDAYHAAHDAAWVKVGQEEIETAAFRQGRIVIDLGFKVMAIDAVTMEGLALKGRAGLAMHRVWADDGGMRIENSYRLLLTNLASLDQREGGL
ncbi:hypothetical protein [Methylobacterium sp. WL120]|uniref:hypothetical protein n=1 Tax=Methylobacterium sp. WL120 TaxID=2603887 RepID=UPI0011C8EA72|nr:hypothetical protein [Methylobacterium sp. WL120]TXM66252.1 hypothetical protein FV229_13175 [Methylobacterium sp. WL120]